MRNLTHLIKSRTPKIGASPGTLIYIGDNKVDNPIITIIDYSKDVYEEININEPTDCIKYQNSDTVTWINIEGINTEIIDKVGDCFNIHPLVKEDILNTDQRPKIEVYDDYSYVVMKMLHFNDKTKTVLSEQVSIILTKNAVVSFQEGFKGDNFTGLRARLKQDKGKVRKMGSDYLLYTLIDAVVDNYFVILEDVGDRLIWLEENIIIKLDNNIISKIHGLKSEMIMLRKSVWPLREVLNRMEKDDDNIIEESTKPFIRDVYDHTIHVIDTIETFRDLLSGMLDIYLTSISNKTNQIMKILTIITTIFIPLTFIAGVYGMNFNTKFPLNMPELNWEYGYPAVMIVMLLTALSLLYYFKRKKWL